MAKRVQIIDVMKGITIILVIFGHAMTAYTSNPILSVNIMESIKYVCDIVYAIHMPIFFIIAGIFAKSTINYSLGEFAAKKFFRLLIPYFTWGLLFAVFKELGRQYANTPGGISDFILSPFLPWVHFWFLYVLFFIHMVYCFTIHFFHSLQVGNIIFILVSFAAYFLHSLFPNFWIIDLLSQYAIFFAVGCYINSIPVYFNRYSHLLTKRTKVIAALTFSIISCGYILSLCIDNLILQNILKMTVAYTGFIIVLVVASILMKYSKIYNFLSFCGKKSMEIYLLHPFILGIARVVIKKPFGFEYIWLQVMILTATAVFFNYHFWKRIDENSKLYRIMFGVIHKKQ